MVPQDAYSSLMSQQKQLFSPVITQLSNLDQELQSIISNPNLPTDAKYHKYMNVFNRYQALKQDSTKQEAPHPKSDIQMNLEVLPVDPKKIVDGLPKTAKNRGNLLMQHIKDNPENFQFQKTGELIVDGNPIPGSNVTDLFHYVTRTRQNAEPPKGFKEFFELLNISNAPKEAISATAVTRSPKLGTAFAPLDTSGPSTSRKSSLPERQTRPKRTRNPVKRWEPYSVQKKKLKL